MQFWGKRVVARVELENFDEAGVQREPKLIILFYLILFISSFANEQ